MIIYRKGNKVSITECDAYAKKHVPGPQKYKLNHNLSEPRTPFLATYTKSERNKPEDGRKIKKDNTVGPATYRPDPGFSRLSTIGRVPKVSFHGLGLNDNTGTIKHKDKLKVK